MRIHTARSREEFALVAHLVAAFSWTDDCAMAEMMVSFAQPLFRDEFEGQLEMFFQEV
jgi:hypothetical protein